MLYYLVYLENIFKNLTISVLRVVIVSIVIIIIISFFIIIFKSQSNITKYTLKH